MIAKFWGTIWHYKPDLDGIDQFFEAHLACQIGDDHPENNYEIFYEHPRK